MAYDKHLANRVRTILKGQKKVEEKKMMGGALGLAILASLAAARTSSLITSGANQLIAFNSGYQTAFLVGALFAGLASFLGAKFLRISAGQSIQH